MIDRVHCALQCVECGELDEALLDGDAVARDVLANLACANCGVVGLAFAPLANVFERRAWASARERQNTPEMKAYFAAYYARPEVKARKAARRQKGRSARRGTVST